MHDVASYPAQVGRSGSDCGGLTRGAMPAAGGTLGIAGGVAVLVTCAPQPTDVLKCDGDVLTAQRPPACSASAGSGTIRPGDSLTDPVSGLEVVCTRAGSGILTFAGRPLQRCPQSASRTR